MEFRVHKEEVGWIFITDDGKYSMLEREGDGLLLPYVLSQKRRQFIWTEDYCRTLDEAIESMLKYEKYVDTIKD